MDVHNDCLSFQLSKSPISLSPQTLHLAEEKFTLKPARNCSGKMTLDGKDSQSKGRVIFFLAFSLRFGSRILKMKRKFETLVLITIITLIES